MTGHLAKKGNKYYVVLNMVDPATGKRKKKWIATGTSRLRRDKKTGEPGAEDILHEILAKYNRGEFVEPTRITVAEVMEKWLTSIEKSEAPATRRSYQSLVRTHILPTFGAREVQTIFGDEIEAWYNELLGRLKPATVSKIHAIMGAAFRKAESWRIISRNPMQGVSGPSMRDHEAEEPLAFWSPQEISAFLQEAAKVRNYPVYALALGTGLRQGELFGLKWEDIDFEARTLTVRRTLRKPTAPPTFGPPKNKQSARTITLSPALIELLEKWRLQQKKDRLRLGASYEDYGLIFTQPNGRPMHPNNLAKREFVRLKRSAGVKDISWHGMRHTHVTDLIRRREHVKVISERIGHASIQVTMDVYGHLLPDMQSDAALAIDAYLPDATSTKILPVIDDTP